MPLVDMKMTYYRCPLDSPSQKEVSLDAAGPFIALCQQEAVTEQTSLSLFLTTVRAVTERGDLKDRPQEVKETLLRPRKFPFAFERHLCHKAMQISYKTHSPPCPMG
jgi:hypothetical protein